MSYPWSTDGYTPPDAQMPNFDTPNIAPPEDVLNSISLDQGNYNELPSITGANNLTGGFDPADISDSVNMSMTGSWSTQDSADYSNPALQSGSSTGNDFSASSAKRQGVPTPVGGNEESWWKKAFSKGMNFAQDQKNEQLLKAGFGLVAGLSSESSRRKSEAGLYAARLNEIQVKDQLEQDANKRFSSSITGLRPVGLINQRPLTRGNGSNVFNANGTMNLTGK